MKKIMLFPFNNDSTSVVNNLELATEDVQVKIASFKEDTLVSSDLLYFDDAFLETVRKIV